jgi:hypothetical protein
MSKNIIITQRYKIQNIKHKNTKYKTQNSKIQNTKIQNIKHKIQNTKVILCCRLWASVRNRPISPHKCFYIDCCTVGAQ